MKVCYTEYVIDVMTACSLSLVKAFEVYYDEAIYGHYYNYHKCSVS